MDRLRNLRSLYPITSNAYENKYALQEVPMSSRPSLIPTSSSQPLRYNIITADIVCAFFTTPASRLDKLFDVPYLDLNSPDGWDALQATLVKVGFMGILSARSAASQLYTLGEILGSLTFLAKLPLGRVIRFFNTYFPSDEVTDITTDALSNAYQQQGPRLPKNKKRKFSQALNDRREVVKEIRLQENEDEHALLKPICLNMYSGFCQWLDVSCEHREPEECRKKYILKMLELGVDILDYRDLPKTIGDKILRGPYHGILIQNTEFLEPNEIEVVVQKADNLRNDRNYEIEARSVTKFCSVLERYIGKWKKRILRTTGVADEVGIFLILLHLNIHDEVTSIIVAHVVQKMFKDVYILQPNIYKKLVESIQVVLMASADDDELNAFLVRCLQRHAMEDDPLDLTETGMKRVQETIYNTLIANTGENQEEA